MSEIALWRQVREIEQELDQIRALSRLTYAKSTYTPTYYGSATAGATTYTVQQGWYWRIGSVLFVTGAVVWTAATGTGNAQVSLPAAPSATFGFRASGSLRIVSVTFTTTTPEILVSPTSALFTMESPVSNAASNIVQVEAAGNIHFSLFYGV